MTIESRRNPALHKNTGWTWLTIGLTVFLIAEIQLFSPLTVHAQDATAQEESAPAAEEPSKPAEENADSSTDDQADKSSEKTTDSKETSAPTEPQIDTSNVQLDFPDDPAAGLKLPDDPTPVKEAPKEEKTVTVQQKRKVDERVRVTGSHIKKMDIEGPSPIMVLDRDYIDNSGYNTVADVLRQTTANSFGSQRQSSGTSAAGVATVDLRGLGADRTLVLMNGKRLPKDPIIGAVDLNLIPMEAIERIDILKDGASATYGSDALGGVINIITKKDFNGTKMGYMYYLPEQKGGIQETISLVSGTSSAKSSTILVGNYTKQNKLNARNRDWSKEGTSTLGSPGSYREKGTSTWYHDPKCNAEDVISLGASGTVCGYNYQDQATTLPEMEQLSFLAEYQQQASQSIDLYGRAMATKKNTRWTYAPSPGILGLDPNEPANADKDLSIPGATADTLNGGSPLPNVTPGSDVEYRYRTVELGNRETAVEETSFNVLGGIKGIYFDTWEWDFSTSLGRAYRFNHNYNGYVLGRKIVDAIEDGDFNPYAAAGSRGSLSQAEYQPWKQTKSEMVQLDLVTSGELFQLPAGPLSLALGGTQTRENYEDMSDTLTTNGEVLGNSGSNGAGSRSTSSAFAELAVPVFSGFELQLASRFDKYSDFGETTNPKAAFRWEMARWLMLRGSWGTGFKAPSMNDLYQANSAGYPTFKDHYACEQDASYCSPRQYLVIQGGNEDLKEEKSDFWNVGMMIQPTKRFSFGVDYWNIKMNNLIGIDLEDITIAQKNAVDVSQYGISVVRDTGGAQEIISMTAPLQNLASREVGGLDVSLNWTIPAGKIDFNFNSQHSLTLHYKQQSFPGFSVKDELGEDGLPPWRNNTSVSMKNSVFELGFLARTIAGHDFYVPEEGKRPHYTEYDSYLNFHLPWKGKVTLGVKNLAGTTPPLDGSNFNNKLNTSLYDVLGRTYYAGYSQSF